MLSRVIAKNFGDVFLRHSVVIYTTITATNTMQLYAVAECNMQRIINK